mmetsp:Transcript_4103/g.11069  ORF Transcript_4103/g.11069 Transcript_4103/m.11069 type:complete len:248 (+) Transcript_4103:263-1006(+)
MTKTLKMSLSSSSTAHSSLDSGATPWHATRFLADFITSSTFFWRSSATAWTMVERFFSLAILRSSFCAFSLVMERSSGRVSVSAERSEEPEPSVRRFSAFLRNMDMRLSIEMLFSMSTPSSFILRMSAMVRVPMAICACISWSIFLDVMPLMIFCASASGRERPFWISASFSVRSAVRPRPSPRICSAWARYALSARPLCTEPTSNWLSPRMSPSWERRVNSDWSRSMVICTPMGAFTVSPCMQNMR